MAVKGIEGIEVHHEKDCLDFYIAALDYNNLRGYEPSPPSVQYVVKTHRRNLIDQYHEQEEKRVEFDRMELKSSDKELLSDVVSSFGIERSGEHGEKRGCETEQHKISIADVEVSRLYVYVGKSHDMYRCGECKLKRHLEDAIEVVKERIRKGDAIMASEDVKEEEEETGSDPTNKEKEEGYPTKKEKEGSARKRRKRNKYYKPARKRNIRVK
ncbi:hypothetical protein D8674_012462 [Pyrus ussuriensis x Pyrus communis]|uniref:Uncharacterized protein n=1 Tax=Pyrus ussuriensis x Pyrus communis TaxID=2448454 RepID=A0A5N5GF07_9ROSA|nr:hypothetical protein D8674_012462 [Pyrus ussuriensis x Pyrus communis]